MTRTTVNAHEYSDDGSAARDMLNGGAKTWLIPLAADMMVEVGRAAGSAVDAAASAAAAAASATTLSGTSTTSTTIGATSKSFTTQPGKQFATQFLRIQRQADPTVYMYGRSTAYNSTTGALTVSVERIAGTGTFSDWDIYVTSMAGGIGPSGTSTVAQRTITSTDTVVATDNFKLLMLSGTFTLGFHAAGTLGSAFSVLLRNTGFGVITLDPSGAETIEGASTILLQPGQELWVTCDGAALHALTINRGADGVLHVQDQKTSGTNGGASSAATYHTRDQNTVVTNTIPGASLSSNLITLPAGIYELEAFASVYSSVGRLYLYNSTDSTYMFGGPNFGGGGSPSVGTVRGQFWISGAKNFELRHYCVSAVPSGLGLAVSASGKPEIFSELLARKVG